MTFERGQSGNPAGRPPGIGRTNELRRLLFSQSEEIIQVAIDKALQGDPAAMKLVLERLLPALRPTDMPVSIPRPDSGDIGDQSTLVIDALLSGGLSADIAIRIMQSLVLHQTVSELKGLEARITALESSNGNNPSATDPAG